MEKHEMVVFVIPYIKERASGNDFLRPLNLEESNFLEGHDGIQSDKKYDSLPQMLQVTKEKMKKIKEILEE